jgi:hypothetical protein
MSYRFRVKSDFLWLELQYLYNLLRRILECCSVCLVHEISRVVSSLVSGLYQCIRFIVTRESLKVYFVKCFSQFLNSKQDTSGNLIGESPSVIIPCVQSQPSFSSTFLHVFLIITYFIC